MMAFAWIYTAIVFVLCVFIPYISIIFGGDDHPALQAAETG